LSYNVNKLFTINSFELSSSKKKWKSERAK
jgi:hypothetical protein